MVSISEQQQPTRPTLRGTFGAVASTHWLASQTGMAMLERGGNAFDAAAAAGLVLHVVEPHLNGLGGDCPVVLYDAGAGAASVLCGQGTAPASATIDHFADLGLDLVPGTGHLAAVVPGSFGTWMTMLAEHGTLPLREVMEPAITYARDGHPLLPRAAATIASVEQLFRGHWSSSAAVYLPGGAVPAPYARFTNPDLGDTLERLLREGEAAGTTPAAQAEGARAAFYSGFVAEAVDAFVRTPVRDTSGRDHAGLLTADDLDGWRPGREAPTVGTLRTPTGDRQVLKTGPWGQGPVLLAQLAILDGYDLPGLLSDPVALVHAGVEAAKLAMADRDAYYGDPLFADVPIDELLSPAYAAARRPLVGDEASGELRPGAAGEVTEAEARARLDRALAAASATVAATAGAASAGTGEPTVSRSGVTRGDTCHVDVADRWGNLVSATPSGAWLQSSPIVPGLGMSLPTRGQMFSLDPTSPSALAPGKRPRTTLSPGLVAAEGTPYLAFGTPGGDQQDQWTVPFLLHHLVGGATLQAAIDAPSWHTTHLVSSFYPREADLRGVEVEARLGTDAVTALQRRGHDVRVVGPWSLGRISAAGYVDGWVQAAANPRGDQGYAVGR